MLWNHSALASFLSLIVKAHVHPVMHGQLRKPQHAYVKRAVRKGQFESGIQGHPYCCQQKSRTVCGRNVQLMPMLFLKRTKIWQRENSKFVDFNDPTQVCRHPSKKRLRISTNDLHCQKLESLSYIFATDSIGLCLLLFTQLSLKVEPSASKTTSTKTAFYMK